VEKVWIFNPELSCLRLGGLSENKLVNLVNPVKKRIACPHLLIGD
jgi:hypothetical protein